MSPTRPTPHSDNIDSVEWITTPPARVGSAVTFVARFMRRRLAYTYEFVDYVPGEHLVMRTQEGDQLPMDGTHQGLDRMELRNRGEPSGFSRLAAPLMEPAMRRANTRDLANLKAILEA